MAGHTTSCGSGFVLENDHSGPEGLIMLQNECQLFVGNSCCHHF